MKHKEGDYITYKVKYPGSLNEMHASGTVESIVNQDGDTVYLVAEGNGGANLTYVKPGDVLTLLTE